MSPEQTAAFMTELEEATGIDASSSPFQRQRLHEAFILVGTAPKGGPERYTVEAVKKQYDALDAGASIAARVPTRGADASGSVR
jgi:hypothetical protein